MTSRCKKWVISAHKADVHTPIGLKVFPIGQTKHCCASSPKVITNWSLCCHQLSYICSSIHSFIHLLIKSPILSFLHSFDHSFIHCPNIQGLFQKGLLQYPHSDSEQPFFWCDLTETTFSEKKKRLQNQGGHAPLADFPTVQCTIFTDICHGTNS